MAFAITQNCCNDASCLSVCPVNCIHPTPDEPDFGKTDLLYIDPRSCIDCGACADACPVDAITRVSRLAPDQEIYAELNADYYRNRSADHLWDAPKFPPPNVHDIGRIAVAIVGTGPAACYAAQAILRTSDARVTFYDRLKTPGGLARFGVAPDHQGTRRIGEHFKSLFVHPRVTMKLGVRVGTDVEPASLADKFDAVVYAVGADVDRAFDVPGADLRGAISARTLVGWYTGHPDVAEDEIDLSGVDRVVVVGNGNVALDAARILTADPDTLASTDIAPHALRALRSHRVREVVILARRGPQFAAFTRSECQALVVRPGVEVAVAGSVDAIDGLPMSAPASALAGAPIVSLSSLPDEGRRIVFAFGASPVSVNGTDRVEFVDIALGDDVVTVPAQLTLRAIGYRGSELQGLPFDPDTGTIRNIDGRVVDASGAHVPGTYVVGWAKRGATGGIGDNKLDAEQTVDALIADAPARASKASLRARLAERIGR
jgi:ferredoxin--NADP+ reductase